MIEYLQGVTEGMNMSNRYSNIIFDTSIQDDNNCIQFY